MGVEERPATAAGQRLALALALALTLAVALPLTWGMVVAERITETGGDSCCCAPEPTKVTRTSILGSVHFLCHSHRFFSAQYSRGARRLTCHGGALWAKAAGAEGCGRGVAGVWG